MDERNHICSPEGNGAAFMSGLRVWRYADMAVRTPAHVGRRSSLRRRGPGSPFTCTAT